MAQQSFKEFLAKGLPFGDALDHAFVYKALRDPDFPDAGSWEEVESYMKGTNPDAEPEALKAAQRLWQLYTAERCELIIGRQTALRGRWRLPGLKAVVV